MQKRFLVEADNPDLLLFALGWASEPSAVAHILPAGHDVLCLYDYRSADPLDAAMLQRYRRINLFAWSFGVLMAELTLRNIPFTKAVALNGTPRPVDDRYGIPIRNFDVTLRGIPRSGTQQFEQRTYGDFYPQAAMWSPSRTLDEKVAELELLHRLSQRATPGAFRWDEAIIGERDLIVPPENQRACWRECSPATTCSEYADMPHYPFADPSVVLSRLG